LKKKSQFCIMEKLEKPHRWNPPSKINAPLIFHIGLQYPGNL